MNQNRCGISIKIIHSFLNATAGNWRNSVYIECRACKQERCDCRDLLYAPDDDGSPLLLPVRDAEILFGRLIDKSECLIEMSNAKFEALFSFHLKRLEPNLEGCSLCRALQQLSQPEDW